MMHQKAYSGRLYLAKGKEEISVDIKQLLPHQLAGIRFLYKIFKKEKSGVILNDPTGYGKTRQVVLFIEAIKHLLSKPIIILCSDHEKNHWLTHFQEFTDFGDGVLVEPPNIFLRIMTVCITTKNYVDLLAKREWSILVVDDDTAINKVLKTKVNAELKIWLTSVDMKNNLDAYWKIFAWLYPKEKNIQNIFSEKKAKQGSITEQILLDAVMEDVVLRRVNNCLTAITGQSKNRDADIKVSRKNKDKTGTKIKRSKIKDKNSTFCNIPSSSELVNVYNNDEQCHEISVKTRSVVGDTNNEGTTTIVDNFIQSTKLIDNDGLQNSTTIKCEVETGEIGLSVKREVADVTYDMHDVEMIKCESSVKRVIGIGEDSCMEIENTEMNISEASNKRDKESSIDGDRNNESTINKAITNEIPTCQPQKANHEKDSNKNIDVYREWEEKAIKKFKGSFLDSIF